MRQRVGLTQPREHAHGPAPLSLPVSLLADTEALAPGNAGEMAHTSASADTLPATQPATQPVAQPALGAELNLAPDLDASIFNSLRELLDEAIVAATYRDFLHSTRTRSAGAAARNGVEAMHQLGHSLRGTAGMLGAVRVATCAGRLEQEAPGSYPHLLAGIAEACVQLEEALRKARVPL